MNEVDYEKYESSLAELEKLQKKFAIKKAEFATECKDLCDEIELKQKEVAEAKTIVVTQAKEDYAITGSKKLKHGIKIRAKRLKKYDALAAFEWAKKTGNCLLLDKKSFEKVGPELTDLVSIEEEVGVTFPTRKA